MNWAACRTGDIAFRQRCARLDFLNVCGAGESGDLLTVWLEEHEQRHQAERQALRAEIAAG